MKESQLNNLINLADTDAPAPRRPQADIATHAIRLAERRKAIRRGGLSVLCVSAVCAVLIISTTRFNQPTQRGANPSAPVASTNHTPSALNAGQPSLDQLRLRIAVQEAVVDSLLAQASPPQPPATVPAVDPRDQADLAAKRMVITANRMEQRLGPNDESTRLYRDVLSHFPDSAWAGIARQRVDPATITPTHPRSAAPCDQPVT